MPVYFGAMAQQSELTGSASELRIVLGQLVRRLRAEHRFPISQATVLSRLDREGAATTSALAAAERVRPQSMAHTSPSSRPTASSTAPPTRTTAARS